MVDLHAPDGSNQPVNTQTFQQLGTLLPFSTAVVFAGGDSDWEQAGIVYVNGIRQAAQIGNFSRPNMFSLGERDFDQEIAVAGWHKRSAPDSEAPWVASRGLAQGTGARWDDSFGDGDFNDFTASISVITGTVHPISG